MPYIALVGEMAANAAARMRLVAWRMAFVALGVLIAGAGAPLIVGQFEQPRDGYTAAGFVLAGLCLITALVATRIAWGFRSPHEAISQQTVSTTLKEILRARNYRWLWISYALQMAGVSANAALLPFAVEFQLRASADTLSAVFVLMTVATLVAMPAAVVLGRRFGQVSGYLLSLLLSGLGLIFFLGGSPEAAAPAMLAAAIFGIGQAGATSYPFALMPGASDFDDDQSQNRNQGAYAGAWTAGEKLGLALGGALAAALLALIGFQEGESVQARRTLELLPWIFAAAPALLFAAALLAALPLLKTNLNRSYTA